MFNYISAQECRQLKYSQPVQDRALTNHVIIKINTTREDICNIRCFIEPNCLSFNVGPLGDHQYLCEISDSDEVLNPEDLVQRMEFTYQGTEVFLELDLFPGQCKRQYGSILFHQQNEEALGKTNKNSSGQGFWSFVGVFRTMILLCSRTLGSTYGLLTKCEVKMAGYWPSSFSRVYGPRGSRGQ